MVMRLLTSRSLVSRAGAWLLPLQRLSAVALIFALPAGAQRDPRKRTDIDKALGEQLYQEQEARLGCKVAICEAARSKVAQGDNIACKVVKTWPDVDLKNKILKGAMDWPWGHAQCEASISLDRKLIAAAVSEPKYEAAIGKHDVICHLNTKDGKDRHTVNLTIDPARHVRERQGHQGVAALEQRDGVDHRQERAVVGNGGG